MAGGYDMKPHQQCCRLGFMPTLPKPLTILSGVRRHERSWPIALGNPDLLVLDEPTIISISTAVEWLESF